MQNGNEKNCYDIWSIIKWITRPWYLRATEREKKWGLVSYSQAILTGQAAWKPSTSGECRHPVKCHFYSVGKKLMCVTVRPLNKLKHTQHRLVSTTDEAERWSLAVQQPVGNQERRCHHLPQSGLYGQQPDSICGEQSRECRARGWDYTRRELRYRCHKDTLFQCSCLMLCVSGGGRRSIGKQTHVTSCLILTSSAGGCWRDTTRAYLLIP